MSCLSVQCQCTRNLSIFLTFPLITINPLPWFQTRGARGSWLESPYAAAATCYPGAARACHQKNHSVSPNWAERPRHAAADSAGPGVVPGSGGGRGGRVPGLPPPAAARHLAAVLGSGATRQDAARRTTAVTRSLSPPPRHSPLFRERRRNHGKGKM